MVTNSYVVSFEDIARLPDESDNVAVAIRKLEAGTTVVLPHRTFIIGHTILEGHRFAVNKINDGEPLLSWQMPFGLATKDILPGQYVCNASILQALAIRQLKINLPTEPNFEDIIPTFNLNEVKIKTPEEADFIDSGVTFKGYRRSQKRGVGTRNVILILGTSSQTASYVKSLAKILQPMAAEYSNIDAIVAAAHTEGGGLNQRPNNLEMVLRTLSGFMVHPNIGAVLAVDYGWEQANNRELNHYLVDNGYDLPDVLHDFMSIKEGFGESLLRGESIVRGWLEAVNGIDRSTVSMSELKIALQCGGSDAFSGISGNPLAACVARKVVQSGGMANMAETPELAGAEAYILHNVRDKAVAQRFLSMIDRFKNRALQHGASIESNTSGGNKLRGLYNIVLKSLGAATKKDPEQSLDFAIDYGEPMQQPGFYFMDSPGLDLESIAGQVASGCNLVLFITGNGSVTNFPFVPTIKIVTTSGRYEMLSNEMDVNAGRYLEGFSMADLSREAINLLVQVASGSLTKGEEAGHSQVQIWRNWQDSSQENLAGKTDTTSFSGQPILLKDRLETPELKFHVLRNKHGFAARQFGLILPTSLCSSEIASIAAERLNLSGFGRDRGLSGFVALNHTEGCASTTGLTGELFERVMVGYACHPLVRYCLFLEHGCEVTHNDFFSHLLIERHINPSRFGWASVQLDGGIADVTRKIGSWFLTALINDEKPHFEEVGLESLRLGIHTIGELDSTIANALGKLVKVVISAGGSVVIPDRASILPIANFAREFAVNSQTSPPLLLPSLAHGQQLTKSGLFIMESQSDHWVETITGLGATGVEIVLAYSGRIPIQGHKLIPVLHIGTIGDDKGNQLAAYDLVLDGDPDGWPIRLLEKIVAVLGQRYTPKAEMLGNTDFQITRGLLGISL